jgi:DNA-binding NtrC family response regulator
LTCNLLEEGGYTVLEAEAPEAAPGIALRHNGPIHILLTDMVLPGMAGRDLAARLAPIRPEMKVVYMSSHIGFTHAGLADPEAALLVKPYNRETLLRKVRETIESEIRVEVK